MIKKEMIAMLLAGGQGSRLGVLTSKLAKPAVAFGGKYKIIDFPLSNCINSGIDTVGVLTQYQPLRLNQHIGIGIPWDLDRNIGGVSILPPYEKSQNTDWYTGTANAIYQNMEFMEYYHPDYVIILGGDHIYKMDYELMLEFHKKNNAQITLATYEVPWEDASRFGLVITDENNQILEFEEKPANPRSNKASMGIYIFNWEVLKEALETLSEQPGCDFGMHVIPYCHKRGDKIKCRHILLKPQYTDMDMEEPYNVLDSVQRQIVDGTITFEEAAMKYSQDKYSKQNGGLASNLEQLEIMNYGDPTEASVKFYKDYLNPDDFRALEKLEIDGVSKPYTTQDYRQRTLCKVVKLKEVIPAHPANIKEDYVQLEKLALAVKQEREFVRWLKSKVDGMYIRIDEDFKDCEFEHSFLLK